MTKKIVHWEGEPLAYLVDGPDGAYLVPPVLPGDDRDVVMNNLRSLKAQLEELQHDQYSAVLLPDLEDATSEEIAEVNRRLAIMSERLGVPIGAPESTECPR